MSAFLRHPFRACLLVALVLARMAVRAWETMRSSNGR